MTIGTVELSHVEGCRRPTVLQDKRGWLRRRKQTESYRHGSSKEYGMKGLSSTYQLELDRFYFSAL